MFLFRQGIYCSSLADYIHQGHVVSLPPPLLLPTSLVELPCKTAQTRLVWGICLGDEILSSYMGIKFINYEIRIPSFSPTRISMESIRPVFFFMAQLLPTFSELRNHITHVLNCCELGDLETQWEDFLLRSIAKKCYPGWRKKTSWYLPLKREKKGNHFLGSGCCVT